MHNFKIPEKFDVIFSANDAINFLKDFDQWKSTFKTVSEHLNGDGLFIFDVFTPKMLRDTLRWREKIKRLTGTRATIFRKFSGGYQDDTGIVKGNTLTWDEKILERLPNGLYQLHEYKFIERIYPVAKMKSALSEHFDILESTFR
jgi:hypothetical protein